MRCERFRPAGDPASLAAELRALVPSPESVAPAVAQIVRDVREGGDAGVVEYTRRLDRTELHSLVACEPSLQAAADGLDPELRAGLEAAIANVRAVAEASLHEDRTVELGSHRVALRSVPVSRAAVYVPGGRAPYPSTVVMGVVTARVAGVEEVVVCSPPGPDDGLVLAACALTRASAAYRMGGAQAIAALAYGTESVPAVDMIVGPGNLYVQEAKRQVSHRVGIDGFAGPSDLLLIADAGADPELAALDLLAQTEHGAGTLTIGVSSSPELLDRLHTRLGQAPDTGAVAALVELAGDDAALALAEAVAPEHLQLIGPNAEALASAVTRAGCVFIGPNAGTAFGDYVAGSNHILPTGGSARFASALSAGTFRRRLTEVRIDDPAGLAAAGAAIARAEGFELHARSMEARIRENG
jgi:histidinol dehydrogenase